MAFLHSYRKAVIKSTVIPKKNEICHELALGSRFAAHRNIAVRIPFLDNSLASSVNSRLLRLCSLSQLVANPKFIAKYSRPEGPWNGTTLERKKHVLIVGCFHPRRKQFPRLSERNTAQSGGMERLHLDVWRERYSVVGEWADLRHWEARDNGDDGSRHALLLFIRTSRTSCRGGSDQLLNKTLSWKRVFLIN